MVKGVEVKRCYENSSIEYINLKGGPKYGEN
jgi:hypothetical protein